MLVAGSGCVFDHNNEGPTMGFFSSIDCWGVGGREKERKEEGTQTKGKEGLKAGRNSLFLCRSWDSIVDTPYLKIYN